MKNEQETLTEIVRAIISHGALKIQPENPFRWASGYAMPVYTDNRCLIGFPEVRASIGQAFVHMIEKSGVKYDAVAGVATGGIPHATTLADLLKLPLLYIRPKAKDHGAGRQVEGDIPGGLAGKNVLVVEDLISTGGSAVKAMEALRKEGANATVCAAIFHYNFTELESKFEQMDPPSKLTPLITFPILLEIAKKENLLTPEVISELETWYADPFNWGSSHNMPQEIPGL